MLIIPKQPEVLSLPLCRLWNEEICPNKKLSSFVFLQQTQEGLHIETQTPTSDVLQKNDTIFLFFVEEEGQYVEIDIEIFGQYRVRGFDEQGILLMDFPQSSFSFEHTQSLSGTLENTLILPWEYFPEKLKSLNAYFVSSGFTLAYHPIPGETPQLHQIQQFPFVRLSS